MPSDNNLIVRSLINTLQREVKPEKLYDLVNRMNNDLNEVFNTVFDGPLSPVDGFELTRLDAASLEGTRLPDTFRVAYLDDLNEFTRGQMITQPDVEEPFWTFGIGDLLSDPVVDPDSFFRIYAYSADEFGIAQNIYFDGATEIRDDNTNGAVELDFYNGICSLYWWDSVLNGFRNTWGWNGREQVIYNFADDPTPLSFALIDDNDVIHLGEDAATDTTPSGYITIPSRDTTEIPIDGDATADGIICIDKTLNYLVFYVNGARYRLAGVAYP